MICNIIAESVGVEKIASSSVRSSFQCSMFKALPLSLSGTLRGLRDAIGSADLTKTAPSPPAAGSCSCRLAEHRGINCGFSAAYWVGAGCSFMPCKFIFFALSGVHKPGLHPPPPPPSRYRLIRTSSICSRLSILNALVFVTPSKCRIVKSRHIFRSCDASALSAILNSVAALRTLMPC